MSACDPRASNGIQCGREFGWKIGKEECRCPTRQEIRNHILGFEHFGLQQQKNIYDATERCAQSEIETHPITLKQRGEERLRLMRLDEQAASQCVGLIKVGWIFTYDTNMKYCNAKWDKERGVCPLQETTFYHHTLHELIEEMKGANAHRVAC